MTMMLSDVVTVARRFQRSVRLDTDFGTAASLQGFICHESGRAALETMARLVSDSQQRAFTWTGPYGGGKSSLALAFASYVSGDPALRKAARAALQSVPDLDAAFPSSKDGWLVIPVSGRRGDPVADIGAALAVAKGARRQRGPAPGRDLIAKLVNEAKARPKDGVLLVIDEMGKFLEDAAAEGADIHFFQDLAEAAGRAPGRLVVLGVLHQAFEQYAGQLGRENRDEWAKVQGRYVDIPLVTAVDEVIDLLARAVVTKADHPDTMRVAENVAAAIRRRRPGSPDNLGERLDQCWPLHPVSAALLGPVSRRRFGQNERSTFGFLCSGEPHGFQDYLRATSVSNCAPYDPAQFWDYLRLNLEPAILASPDGHRWAQGVDAIERCEAKGTPLHIRLAKTIALIDLFRNGSGIVPERAVLDACLAERPRREIDQALDDLEQWSIVIFRKHLDAWAIYAGSDFDVDEAVDAAMVSASDLDLQRLQEIAGLQPVLAKEHYYRTGTLRWFDTVLAPLEQAAELVEGFQPRGGAAGIFVLALPDGERPHRSTLALCRKASAGAGLYPVAVGLPRNAWLLRQLGAELIALEIVRTTRSELEGDAVARREIAARIAAVSAQLEEELRASFADAKWYIRGSAHDSSDAPNLARLASLLADQTFPGAPRIHSELVNRQQLSSNSQAAVRQLMYMMVERPTVANLGIEGYPAERGLYSTVLESTGLHRELEDGTFGFAPPAGTEKAASFVQMWQRAEELLAATDELLPLPALYNEWTAPPFGVRRGVLPLLALAFIQAHRAKLAVYAEDVFRPEIDRHVVDLLLQDEKLIALRPVSLDGRNTEILDDIRKALTQITGAAPAPEPLEVARALVKFVFNLPAWTRRTTTLPPEATAVRGVLLTASDPHRALFVDLPLQFESLPKTRMKRALAKALHDLNEAYPRMLSDIQERMLAALNHRTADLAPLRSRAQIVRGLSGDLRLDTFADRLAEFSGTAEQMEAIASMAINRPPREWADRDPDRALLQLAELAWSFRRAEALAAVKGRMPSVDSIAIVTGAGGPGDTATASIEVTADERAVVDGLAAQIDKLLERTKTDPRLMLAALARTGVRLAALQGDDTSDDSFVPRQKAAGGKG